MGRSIERALQLTDRVEGEPEPKPSKGKIWKDRPRYTLEQLLREEPEAPDENDEDIPDEFLNLPTAML